VAVLSVSNNIEKEFTYRGLSENSGYSLGELLGKSTRNRLALICLRTIDENRELIVDSKADRVGRPRSNEAILAGMLGVSVRTVDRWIDAEGIQASDLNAERLAEFAYHYSPVEVARILREEAEEHVYVVESWLSAMSDCLEG
jgi:hypothetical protein